MSGRFEVRLPRWRSVALLLVPLDLLLLGWALLLYLQPARGPALVLIGAAFLCFLSFLIQCFAWVTVIAFFARERARGRSDRRADGDAEIRERIADGSQSAASQFRSRRARSARRLR